MVYNTSMLTKWIRWKGFGAFVIIIAGIAAFWLILADSLVKSTIENAGTSAIGAKVELKTADLSLFPLGLTLTGLEVTNPDEPMKNAFEAGRLAFLMDSAMLFNGKVIIDEMSAQGLQLDTDRKTSGRIDDKAGQDRKKADAPAVPGESAGMGMAGFEVPDVEEILGREELETLRLADKVSADIKKKEDHWDTRLKTLPDSGTLKDFERRYKEIERKFNGSTRDKIEAVSDAKKLQDDIKTAKNTINKAATALETDYKELRDNINMALKAPDKDIRRLKDKYQISSKGAENLSSLIFGPKINEYIKKARSVYSIAEPFMKSADEKPKKVERSKGTDVKFREFNPTPAFWAKKVKADLLLAPGPVTGTISDISSDQRTTGKPTAFRLSGQGFEKARSIEVKGSLDHRITETPKDEFSLDIKDRTISDLELSSSSELPVTIKRGSSDTSVHAWIGSGGTFRSTATVKVRSAEIESSPSGGDIAKAMGRAISSLEGFSVDIRAEGTLSDYRISVSSDIDRALKAAVGNLLREESNKFEARLKSSIKEKTDARLAGLKGELKGIEDRKSLVNTNSGSLESLLSKSSGIKADKLLKF